MAREKVKYQQSKAGREIPLFTYMEEIIERLTQLRQIGTAKNYMATLRSLRRFLKNREVGLSHIDSLIMEDYQTYLKSIGLTLNSISFYMRIIRAVYNRAIRQGLITDKKPFHSVFTGIEKTRKRAIGFREIKKIRNLDLSRNPNLEFARDIFIFLFFCRGMSFIDAAFLRKNNIKNGVLTYYRHKTGQKLHIKVIRQIHDILDRYNLPDSPFLLPIITDSEANERRQYESALRRINKDLKKIGNLAGLSISLSTYVCRHSWATIAKTKNVPINVISDALGHESIATTQIYLDSIGTSTIDRANEIVINGL